MEAPVSPEFPVSCPECGMSYQVPKHLAGAKAGCESCGANFVLPDFSKIPDMAQASVEKESGPRSTPPSSSGSGGFLKNLLLVSAGAAIVAGGSILWRKEPPPPDALPPRAAAPPPAPADATPVMASTVDGIAELLPVGRAPEITPPPPENPAPGQAMQNGLPDASLAQNPAGLPQSALAPSGPSSHSVTPLSPPAEPSVVLPEATLPTASPQPARTAGAIPAFGPPAAAEPALPGDATPAPAADSPPPPPLPETASAIVGTPPLPAAGTSVPAPLTPRPASAPPPVRDDSRTALEHFLGAATLPERLTVSQHPDKIRTEMELFHQTHPMGPLPLTELAFLTEDRVPETGKKLHLYNVFLRDRDAPIPVAVEETADGYRVDWQAFAESYSHSLRAFFAAPRDTPGRFRVLLRRAHYFGPPVPGQDTDRMCYSVDPPMRDETFQVWADRDSAVFQEKLATGGRAGWETESYLIVELIWKGNAERGRWVGLQRIVSDSWRSP